MRFKEIFKKYAFHIFALVVFLFVRVYKFFPHILSFEKDVSPNTEDTKNIPENSFIYVDLSGAVAKPGVYKIPSISRVGDLISVGGGFSNNSSVLWISRNINLAKLLYDSQKIYVPYEWETYGDCTCAIDSLYLETPLISTGNTSVTTSSSSTDSKVSGDTSQESLLGDKINVNTATADELDVLSGIGPAYAQKIISNRPYKDFSELISKSGISETTLNKISAQLIY